LLVNILLLDFDMAVTTYREEQSQVKRSQVRSAIANPRFDGIDVFIASK